MLTRYREIFGVKRFLVLTLIGLILVASDVAPALILNTLASHSDQLSNQVLYFFIMILIARFIMSIICHAILNFCVADAVLKLKLSVVKMLSDTLPDARQEVRLDEIQSSFGTWGIQVQNSLYASIKLLVEVVTLICLTTFIFYNFQVRFLHILYLVFALLLFVTLSLVVRYFIRSLGTKIDSLTSESLGFAQDSWQGVREILGDRKSAYFSSRMIDTFLAIRNRAFIHSTITHVPRYFLETMALTIMCIFFMKTETTILSLLGFIYALFRLLPVLNSLFANLNVIAFSRFALKKVLEISTKDQAHPDLFMGKLETLELDKISLTLEGRQIFHNFSLNISSKEKIAIIGASGSGKSTLLKLISGEILVDSGTRRVNGNASDTVLRFGYLGQDPFIFSGTGIENIFFNSDPLVSSEELRKYTEQLALDYARLTDQRLDVSREFSGGEKQRLAILRCLLTKTDLILMDEPTSALDWRSSIAAQNLILSIDATVILITHDINFARKFDRVIDLDSNF